MTTLQVIGNPAPASTRSTGKHQFFSRLFQAMERLSLATVVSTPEPGAIFLHASKHRPIRGCVNVLRQDGVFPIPGHFRKNGRIRLACKNTDAIVFQSQHSRMMTLKHVCTPEKPWAVIRNGCYPEEFQDVAPADCSTQHLILAVARWRPSKQLAAIVECFLEAGLPDATLRVLGNTREAKISRDVIAGWCKNPRVQFLGVLSQRDLCAQWKRATAGIHLTADWCPNSVVEGLGYGTPILCTSYGGTHELLEACNASYCIAPVSLEEYDRMGRKTYSPQEKQALCETLGLIVQLAPRVDGSPLHIDRVAEKYVEFFRSLQA